MKHWLAVGLFAMILWTLPVDGQAATVKNGKDYLPTNDYQYTYYSDGKSFHVTCRKNVCFNDNAKMGLTYHYTAKNYTVTVNDSSTIFLSPIKFPLQTGKTYKGKDVILDEVYPYTYTLLKADFSKKVGKKTYHNVLKLKYGHGTIVYIAKKHGVILERSTTETYFKVTNYQKR